MEIFKPRITRDPPATHPRPTHDLPATHSRPTRDPPDMFKMLVVCVLRSFVFELFDVCVLSVYEMYLFIVPELLKSLKY